MSSRTLVPTIEAEQALSARAAATIDLRAPDEFREDRLPGAINVPLFDDSERELVGTLYHRASPEAAFDVGRRAARDGVVELVAQVARAIDWTPPEADLAALVDELTQHGLRSFDAELETAPIAAVPARATILYCWRGGLRSRSVAALLQRLGLESAVIVRGGYKSYRRAVVDELERWRPPATFVLRGLTGVGKSLVLRALEEIRPGWTIDLEGLARHRSSILGGAGLAPALQKEFESGLAQRVREGRPGPLVVEGESRKVGDVILPRALWRALEGGTSLELVAPVERRVEVLVEDYLAHPQSRADLREPLGFIEQRLGEREWDGELVKMLETGRERVLARLLLERYYDPRYRHSELGRRYAASFDASDPRRCADEIAAWIEARGFEANETR